MADLKIGHYTTKEKPKSTARNRCATGPPEGGRYIGWAEGCWTEMGGADRLVVYASILYGG